MTSGRNGLEFFAVGVDDCLVVRWPNSRTHRGSPQRFCSHPGPDAHVVEVSCWIDPQYFHRAVSVLIKLTKGRAQRLVLQATGAGGLDAYRFLLRRYEPVSAVTTVSNLVDLLATTFSGDLMESLTESLTDFERRVSSWEQDAQETLSDLIKIGVAIKGLEKGGFRHHLLINTAGSTERTKFATQIELVELARKNTQPVPMDLSAMGSQDQKFQ